MEELSKEELRNLIIENPYRYKQFIEKMPVEEVNKIVKTFAIKDIRNHLCLDSYIHQYIIQQDIQKQAPNHNFNCYIKEDILFYIIRQLPDKFDVHLLANAILEGYIKYFAYYQSPNSYVGIIGEAFDVIKQDLVNLLDISKLHNWTYMLCNLLRYKLTDEQREQLIDKIYICLSKKKGNINHLDKSLLTEEDFDKLKTVIFIKELEK